MQSIDSTSEATLPPGVEGQKPAATIERNRWLLLPLVLAATGSLLLFRTNAQRLIRPELLALNYLDGVLKYQLITLLLALLFLGAAIVLGPHTFRTFFSMGRINAPAEPIRFIDIRPGDTWLKVGRSFAIIVSLATFAFIYFQIMRGQSIQAENIHYLPWILVFAATNAFVEEMLTRFGVVMALHGFVSNRWIPIVSALVFGLPHFFGVPGGILGSIMAGFLG